MLMLTLALLEWTSKLKFDLAESTAVTLLQDYFVEVDVVMPANTELWRAHDVAQKLQDQIEILPRVERAFVHVDHEATHRPVSPGFEEVKLR